MLAREPLMRRLEHVCQIRNTCRVFIRAKLIPLPECGSLEEGIKRDALLTYVGNATCRLRLTLALTCPPVLLGCAVSKASRSIPSSIRR